MMTYKIFMTTFLIFTSVAIAYCQLRALNDCSVLKKYKLQYLSLKDSSAYIRISQDSVVEYHHHEKYTLRAKIDWTNDREYDMTLTSVTIPDFSYRPGDVMHVRIDRIEHDIIYYISTINGNSWEGKLRVVR